MNKFFINYGTGAGNMEIVGTLEDATKAADMGACYTQQDIKVLYDDISGELAAVRRWRGVAADPDEIDTDNIIDYGKFGYYEDWTIL